MIALKTSKKMESDSKTKRKDKQQRLSELDDDAGPLPKSIWVRCRSILVDSFNWKLMERERDFVWISGAFLWVIFLLSMAI